MIEKCRKEGVTILFLRMLSLVLVIFCLTACSFGGIVVAPTAPSREPTAAQTQEATLPNQTEPTASTQTTISATRPPVTEPTTTQISTTPPETTAPQVTTPSVPATEPADFPVTEPMNGEERHDPRRPEAYKISVAEQVLLDRIQAMRDQKQLPPLLADNMLGGLAYLRANEIVNRFGHIRPDDKGYATVFTDYGYVVSASGETILKCESWYPAAYVLEDWLSSGATAGVLNDPAFTHVGVGIYKLNGSQYLVCLLASK